MKSTSLVYSALTTICLVGVVPARPALATTFLSTYVSPTGNDANSCIITAPCATLSHAQDQTDSGGVIHCLGTQDYAPTIIFQSITIDCSDTSSSIDGPTIQVPSTAIVRLIGLEIRSPIVFQLGAALYIEKCKIFGSSGSTSLVFEPQQGTAASLYVSDSYIDGNAAGVLLQPVNESATATFDHVKITNNSGGGIKINTTNGPVSVDITDSVISNNSGNGINAVGNAGGQALVSIKNSVIAKNGAAGVQANGANAGVLVQTTLFDQNASGATSVVGGGHISTYGNNSIVGSAGSGFTGSAPLQ